MLKDNKNDTANPHKIFVFPDDRQSGGEKGDETRCDNDNDNDKSFILHLPSG